MVPSASSCSSKGNTHEPKKAVAAPSKITRETGRTERWRKINWERKEAAFFMHKARLTILAISEVGLPGGSFAQILSRCGGWCKAQRCSSWSRGWRRNLWSILVCLWCAETVTCWKDISWFVCFSPQRTFSSVALAFYTICVQKRRKKVDDFWHHYHLTKNTSSQGTNYHLFT